MKHTFVVALCALAFIRPIGYAWGGEAEADACPASGGRTIYARQCSRCHGYNMINNGGLIALDLRKFPKDDHDRFVNAVAKAKPPRCRHGAMSCRRTTSKRCGLMSRAGDAMNRLGPLASLLASLVLISPVAKAAEPLRICLDEQCAAVFLQAGARTGGFDLALAQAIADKLGRALSVQWFEAEDQPEKGKDTKTGVAALLADRRCDLAGAYPLLTDSLAGSLPQEARLPRYQGRTRMIDAARSR